MIKKYQTSLSKNSNPMNLINSKKELNEVGIKSRYDLLYINEYFREKRIVIEKFNGKNNN